MVGLTVNQFRGEKKYVRECFFNSKPKFSKISTFSKIIYLYLKKQKSEIEWDIRYMFEQKKYLVTL